MRENGKEPKCSNLCQGSIATLFAMRGIVAKSTRSIHNTEKYSNSIILESLGIENYSFASELSMRHKKDLFEITIRICTEMMIQLCSQHRVSQLSASRALTG